MTIKRTRPASRSRSVPAGEPPRALRARRRRVASGDIGPTRYAAAVERHAVAERIAAKRDAEVGALQDILAGRSPVDSADVMKRVVSEHRRRVRARC